MKYAALMATCASLAIVSPALAGGGGKGEANMLDDARFMKVEPAPIVAPVAPTLPPPVIERTIMTEKIIRDKFAGAYLGAALGYSFGEVAINVAGVDLDTDVKGISGSAYAGYTMRTLGGYLGFEIAHEWSGADGDVVAGVTIDRDTAWSLTVRPGFAIGENTLAYGILGYSRATYEGLGSDETFGGAIFGLGAEFATGTPLRARLEYTYTDYSEETVGGVDFEPVDNAIRLGLLYRF
ncbi:MAG: outer membrane beta-barrel protein [Alphaproteobacteria bacterium]|nr:outer membrane beta-barrel protein [Alphaproteobacteria bacterium]